jgi:hypothetical protein
VAPTDLVQFAPFLEKDSKKVANCTKPQSQALYANQDRDESLFRGLIRGNRFQVRSWCKVSGKGSKSCSGLHGSRSLLSFYTAEF